VQRNGHKKKLSHTVGTLTKNEHKHASNTVRVTHFCFAITHVLKVLLDHFDRVLDTTQLQLERLQVFLLRDRRIVLRLDTRMKVELDQTSRQRAYFLASPVRTRVIVRTRFFPRVLSSDKPHTKQQMHNVNNNDNETV
jgi:hypothetical protein